MTGRTDDRDGTDDDGASGTDGSSVTRRALLAATSATAASSAGCAVITTPEDLASGTSIRGNVGYFAGVDWLLDNREGVVLLDARSGEKYRTERIYGARPAPFEELTARKTTERGAVPDVETLAEALGSVGVQSGDDVVVYGSSVGSRVTRVVFALEHLGHEGDVRILNGGYPAWTGRVGTGRRTVESASYDPGRRDGTVVTQDWLSERLGSFNTGSGPHLVDVRPPEAYLAARGADALVESNARHGHLPGAVEVDWVGNVAGRTLADPGDLFDLYGNRAGLSEDRPVVVYGQENVDPTNTWAVLRALGFTDVRLYDGGFAEWANVAESRRGDYPVETKTHAVVETDGEVGGGDGGGFSCTG